ncbi:2-oxo acid dehydrogenase subunit E2 [Adhaeretor mobilis]|uniref:Dihydrolipoamide acetyltransferase component of pyruvate dehydrogenase complex n=1 Tax=Adhaeretor mobilis TaxID=1930276 RepID=A0A517N2N2_9BACT|nr:2-oxo acid dehydrogenase subunit E2 [Adhaeretor mobilis]QDT01394.1 Dihydrolipoyllysine-residue acetyltransferase component of pyruvate dehydrogenase complex [Adhaeretor mobilis]
MPTQIKLPNLGENVESGDVLSLFVSEGDVVAKDQDLMELETDKATLPIPSPQAGKIVKILVAEGDTVTIDQAIIEIEAADGAGTSEPAPGPAASAAGSDASPEPEPEPAKQAPEPVPASEVSDGGLPGSAAPEPKSAPQPTEAHADAPSRAVSSQATVSSPSAPQPNVDLPGDGHSAAAAGPAVRRLARELGVDLRRVQPAAGDRITEADVQAFVRSNNQQAAASAPKGVTPPGMPDSDGGGAVRVEKMSRMRQTIARNMLASYSNIPQLTNFDDVDVTELERIRKESKEDYAAQGVKLTHMPFIVKSVATALKHHPIVNASVSDEGVEIIYKEYVNIGIAVDTDRGLVVPVLRDADRKSIPQIAREIAEIAEAARTGTLSVDDMRGGTFTISNLGAIGGTYSTPIINPPEAAILLIGRSRILPQFDKASGEFQPRLMMPLSISYDHRIVDGAAAARFLNDAKSYLANPGRLLMAP